MTATPRHLLKPGAGNYGSAVQTRGVMACYVVERREVPQMMWAADGGDFTAAQIRIATGLWMQNAFTPGSAPPQCVICRHTFTSPVEPEAFMVALPRRGDGDSIVSALCTQCVRKIGSDGLLATAIEHFKRLWPKAGVTR